MATKQGANRKYSISGTVIDHASGKGATGLRIQAWDMDVKYHDFLAETTSDACGAFKFSFDDAFFKDRNRDLAPDLYFKIYRASDLIADTRDTVIWNAKSRTKNIRIEIDTIKPKRDFSVTGQVRSADGYPLTGAKVHAFDQDMRSEKLLGEAVTDKDGRYVIRYTQQQLSRKEKAAADLIVRVFIGAAAKAAVSSDVRFNAAQVLVIDLTVPADAHRGPSEFERLKLSIEPLLTKIKIIGKPKPTLIDKLLELKKDDIDFIAGNIRIDRQKPERLMTAAVAHTTLLDKQLNIPVEHIYGLAVQGSRVDDLDKMIARKLPAARRALEAAVAANTIPLATKTQIDATINGLRALMVRHVLAPAATADGWSVGDLLATSRLKRADQERLITVALEHEGNTDDYWEKVKNTPEFHADAQVDEAWTTLQLGAFTGYHLPLVQSLQALRGTGQIKSLRDLARLDENDWFELVRKSGVPAEVPGNDDETRARTYAQGIHGQVEAAFPSVAISAMVTRDTSWPNNPELSAFFAANPDYDLLLDSVERSAVTKPLSGTVQKELKSVQRLARIAPRSAAVKALKVAGIDSGQQVAAMSEGAFHAQFKEAIPDKATRQQIYRAAIQRSGMVYHLRTRFAREYDGMRIYNIPPALPDAPPTPETPVNLTELFGSPDVCACKHCRSVLSPAAYLVDLLQFIKHETDQKLWALKSVGRYPRRPDIVKISLNCANTDTPLPYIDLVNEVLEQTVAGATDLVPLQTTWTADELAANPEHIVAPDAYKKLKQLVYPWVLPFDVDAAEARLYLKHLCTSRHELMEVFYSGQDRMADADIAAEFLGLTKLEWQIIQGNSLYLPRDHWGYKVEDEDSWVAALSNNTSELLKRAGIDFETLQALLKTKFVNWHDKLNIEYAKDCTLDKATINFTDDPDALMRLARFIRLQRALGWSIGEVDVALRALGNAAIVGDVPLLTLAHLQRLREGLQRPVMELLTLFAPLPKWPENKERPSLYEQVFLNKTGIHPQEDEQRKAFEFGRLGGDDNMTDYLPHISAALGISTDKVVALIDWLDGWKIPTTISIASLSVLYRLVRLARALQLKLPALFSLIDLHGIGPAAPGAANTLHPFTPAEVFSLLDGLDRQQATEFSVTELDYLFRHRYAVPAAAEASLRQRAIILDGLRSGLRKIADEYALPPATGSSTQQPISDPQGELLQHHLALALPAEWVEPMMSWVRDELGTKPRMNLMSTLKALPVSNNFFRDFDFHAAEKQFTGTATIEKPDQKAARLQQNYDYVLRLLIPWLRRTLSRTFVKQHLADALKIESALCEGLLEEWVNAVVAAPPAATKPTAAIDAFLDWQGFVETDAAIVLEKFQDQQQAAATFSVQFDTLLSLQKVAMVLAKLHITAREADYLFKAGNVDWLDPRALPLTEPNHPEQARKLYAGWQRLVDVCALRDRVGPGEPGLFDLLELAEQPPASAPQEAFFTTIATRMGWQNDDFAELRTRFNTTTAQAFLDEGTWLRLEKCFRLSARIGVLVAKPQGENQPNILGWLTATGGSMVAQSIKSAARARYDSDKAWAEVARPLQDKVREQKRTALVGALTGAWNWNTNQLYAHLLIDTEMSACMLTSRIKQAISSVQLFIQRIFLDLEGTTFHTRGEAELQWAWMKNYRVWEANRKIFLFPENWIEPDLRDDKSPFFKELENELRQGEITPENVEKIYVNYLHKLDTVSSLEIVGQCYGEADGQDKFHGFYQTTHVFGRTRNTPHVYYYRRKDTFNIWHPWEKVNLDIEADQLVPVVWSGRLYLYWPIFKEVTEKPVSDVGAEPSEKPEPNRYWTIQLAWSQFAQGGWVPKKISSASLMPLQIISSAYLDPSQKNAVPVYLYDAKALKNVTGGQLLEPSNEQKSLFEFDTRKKHNGDLTLNVYYPDNWFKYEGSESAFLRGFNTVCSAGWFDISSNAIHAFGQTDGVPIFEATVGLSPTQNGAQFGREKVGYQNDNVSVKIDIGPISITLFEYRILWTASSEDYRLFIGDTAYLVEGSERFYYSDSRRTIRLQGMTPSVFYHPYVSNFIQFLHQEGIDGLLKPTPSTDGLYRQRRVERLFDQQNGPFTNWYKGLDVSRIITYNGPSPDIFQPREDITFEDQEAYSLYNWELFFHIPLLIADKLSNNQRFEEAMRWFNYIFDPLNPDKTDVFDWQRAWKLGRFFDNGDATRSVEELLTLLSKESVTTNWEEFAQKLDWYFGSKKTPESILRTSLSDQIARWQNDPFKPHLLARMRITPYMKTVVMKYLENLIAWADQLFRRDTIESINEASQLYILAAEILGPRPQQLPERQHTDHSYADIPEDKLDSFSNALEDEIPSGRLSLSVIDVPNILMTVSPNNAKALKTSTTRYLLAAAGSPLLETGSETTGGMSTRKLNVEQAGDEVAQAIDAFESAITWHVSDKAPAPPPALRLPPAGLYFCIPQNDKLVAYWDTVADRLFKVRHCMNIEGVVRELPLFEPPIDPALLVKAAAAGVDFSTVLNDLSTPTPRYRFTLMAQKASELCQEVKSLGGALLAALEKRDAEGIALLRSEHEIRMLNLVREVRKQQIEEAQDNKLSLEQGKTGADTRKKHYEAVSGWLSEEKQFLSKQVESMLFQVLSQYAGIQGAAASAVPDVTTSAAGMCSGVHADIGGGKKFAIIANVISGYLGMAATIASHEGTAASYRGGLLRAQQDRDLQIKLAANEITQIDKQIAAADIRMQIAEQELANHDQQTENAQAVDDYMRSKFTNEELYDWMVGQIAGTYFQTYRLAYDTAKRAERAYRFELGLTDSNFIQFGYWDSLRKGLLAGEGLTLALKRMEMAYLENNRRDYEISRHVSLVLHDPSKLILLKESGSCEVELPETLFDADYPGHYFRRIKSVSLTIPCVVGPYTGINCTLTLLTNKTRIKSTSDPQYAQKVDEEDLRFVSNFAPMQSIATSHAQNDSGLFELNFRDDRYLPFEGAGAISRWRIELPKENNAFDFDTIADVVLKLNYTARDGGGQLRQAARDALDTRISEVTKEGGAEEKATGLNPPLQRLFMVRHEFPDQWHRFLHGTDGQALELNLDMERFPYLFRGKTIQVVTVDLYLQFQESGSIKTPAELCLSLTSPSEEPVALVPVITDPSKPKWDHLGSVWTIKLLYEDSGPGPGKWTLTAGSSAGGQQVTAAQLQAAVSDLAVLVTYVVSKK